MRFAVQVGDDGLDFQHIGKRPDRITVLETPVALRIDLYEPGFSLALRLNMQGDGGVGDGQAVKGGHRAPDGERVAGGHLLRVGFQLHLEGGQLVFGHLNGGALPGTGPHITLPTFGGLVQTEDPQGVFPNGLR